MNEEPKVSERLQYVIGALISVVMIWGYLVLSGDQEEQASRDPADLKPADLNQIEGKK